MLRYSPPKRTLGPRAQANQKARRETWPAVLRRAGYRCEMCQSREQLFWAHCVGSPATGLRLGEIANSEALTCALCRDCHDALDRRRPRTDEDEFRVYTLLREALERLESMVGGKIVNRHENEQQVRWCIRETAARLGEPSHAH